MALEDANYISQLVPANPPGSDQASTTDDHLRVVKRAVLQSFPNINGVVNCTPAQLNGLTGLGNNRVVLTSASGVLTTSSYTSASLARIANTLTANRALVSDGSGNIVAHGTVSDTELGYLNTVSSNIQTQLNNLSSSKANVSHDHTGGSETAIPTAGIADLAITAAKLAENAVTEEKINWNLSATTSLSLDLDGDTAVVPAGLYVATYEGESDCQLQINNGSWQTNSKSFGGGVIVSDGINVRFLRTGNIGAMYVRLLKLQ